MIDFRYHLVSLMAVLVALTIGIVLGAGPLDNPISSNLKGQVDKLSESQAKLSAENKTMKKLVNSREQFIGATGSALVKDTLTGVTVALLATDTANKDDINATQTVLAEAGATTVGIVQLTESYSNPNGAPYRDELAVQVTEHLANKPDEQTGTAKVLAAGLFEALTVTTEQRNELLDLYSTGSSPMIQMTGKPKQPAQAIVLVTARAVQVPAEKAQENENSLDEVRSQMLTELSRAISSASEGSAVIGAAQSNVDELNPIRAAKVPVITIDDIGSVVATYSVPLALSYRGTVKAFGIGIGAEAPYPAIQK
ncbi:MAG: copper transporter [Varibaculum sp.]|nr:copper transporter [Varibaculum sp.]